jgi:hypothetical protein
VTPRNIDMPEGLRAALRLLIDGATRPALFHRWSIDRVCTKLAEMYVIFFCVVFICIVLCYFSSSSQC